MRKYVVVLMLFIGCSFAINQLKHLTEINVLGSKDMGYDALQTDGYVQKVRLPISLAVTENYFLLIEKKDLSIRKRYAENANGEKISYYFSEIENDFAREEVDEFIISVTQLDSLGSHSFDVLIYPSEVEFYIKLLSGQLVSPGDYFDEVYLHLYKGTPSLVDTWEQVDSKRIMVKVRVRSVTRIELVDRELNMEYISLLRGQNYGFNVLSNIPYKLMIESSITAVEDTEAAIGGHRPSLSVKIDTTNYVLKSGGALVWDAQQPTSISGKDTDMLIKILPDANQTFLYKVDGNISISVFPDKEE